MTDGFTTTTFAVDNYVNFTQDETGRTGTTISFDVSEQDGRTEVYCTHQDLVPADECFETCSTAWDFFVNGSLFANGSLQSLITTGEGQPNGRGRRRFPAEEVAPGQAR